MSLWKNTLFVLLCVTLAGCATPKPAMIDYDRSVNFSQYQTFSFFTEPQTAPDEAPTDYDPLLAQHFKAAIRREMSALGYQEVTDTPQLWVNYLTNVTSRQDIRSSPFRFNVGFGHFSRNTAVSLGFPVVGAPVEQVNYQVGTLVIEVIDVAAKRVIWQGGVEGRLSRKAMQQPQQAIDETVNLIFQRYPTRLGS